MKFEYIKMHNYRQFKDATIDFPIEESNKNFIIIIGTTGAGKTNILNAVTWCLYGIEYNIRDVDRGLPLLNTISLDELSEGDSCDVVVEIQLTGPENEKIIFKRTLKYYKEEDEAKVIKDRKSNARDGSTFIMLRQKGRDIIPIPDPDYVLNRIIPKSIEEYFFFDGERLDDYFEDATGGDIKDSVLKISQIGVFERMLKHIEDRKKVYVKKHRNMSSRAKQIRSELQVWERSNEREGEELERLKAQRSKADRQFNEISDKLLKYSDINVSKSEEERVYLEDRIIRFKSRLVNIELDKFKFLVDNIMGIYLYPSLSNLLDIIKNSEETGKIPPEYRKPFLERLLKEKVCICGIDLSSNIEHRVNIELLLNTYDDIGELSKLLMRLEGNINNVNTIVAKFEKIREKHNIDIRELEKEIETDNKLINKIDELLMGIDKEEVLKLNNRRTEWYKKVQNLNLKIGRKEQEIEGYIKTIKDSEKQLKEELRKHERSKKLANIIDFSNDVLEIINNIKEETMREIKNEIESKTKKQFFSLIWKTEDYDDITIDDNYNVSVKHSSGYEGIGTLSAGEGIILALSFMSALNSVSGFDVPIIIDTPLGRIDQEPREKIARNLPDFLPNKQVTMLVTTTEYTPSIEKLLSKRVGKTFKINFIEMGIGGVSEVVPVE